jgi:lysophospholipase L1-like esterase
MHTFARGRSRVRSDARVRRHRERGRGDESVNSCIRLVSVCIALWAGCGRGKVSEAWIDPVPRSRPANFPTVESLPVFQPGFHQALRWSDRTPGLVTFRFKIPMARAGDRIRAALRAGDGPMDLHRVSVAKAGAGGTLRSDPTPLTFDGGESVALGPGQRIVSDPVSFRVEPHDELAVSFAAEGAVASSAISAFPESFLASGDQTLLNDLVEAIPHHRLLGVQTIEVESSFDRAFVAIGDSITEGYVTGDDDHRLAWPAIAAAASGSPVVNAAVSGQGVSETTEHLRDDVDVLHGHTDCLVLVGTNDLGAKSAAELIAALSTLFDALTSGGCRVWAGTLLPKERTTAGELAEVKARRAEVNDWLRSQKAAFEVIDFEKALAAPGDPHRFAPGFGVDGIHPTYTGQKVMGDLAATLISAQPTR